MVNSARFGWTVLLPVKVLARAKSRLAVLAGPRRCELALALAADTVAAVAACPEVARVVAVTSDPMAGPRLAALGAIVVLDAPNGGPGMNWRDGPGERNTPVTMNGLAGPEGSGPADDLGLGGPSGPSGSGGPGGMDRPSAPGGEDSLNAALLYGAAEAASRWPGTGLAALTADLPALRPAGLAAALRAAAGHRAAFVPDAAGVGTTLYAVVPDGEFRPMFGGASRARHARAGAVELDAEPGLRRDVDTPDDLRTALALGAGPRTTALAAELLADVHP